VSGCPDGRCDGSGFLYDEGSRAARPCTCRPRRIARRKARKLAGVIPRRYQGVSFDRPPVTHMPPDVVRAVRSYVGALDERLAEGRGIWFSGDVGTGKTTLAMLISAEALRRGHSVAIYSLPRLLGLLRATFQDESEASLGVLLERLAAVELLHVDDVGAEQTSPWVLEQLYTIVNTRYEDGRAILLTTNLVTIEGDEALQEQIGARTVSRLYEICGEPKAMFGDDQRKVIRYEPSAGLARDEEPGGGSLDWEERPPAYGEPRRRFAS
jgi:DNA replication protein DnaC